MKTTTTTSSAPHIIKSGLTYIDVFIKQRRVLLNRHLKHEAYGSKFRKLLEESWDKWRDECIS